MHDKNILLRLQKRAARIVVGNFDFNVNSLNIIKSLKWQLFDNRRDYFLAYIMYNCIYGNAPVRLCNEVEMVCDRHDVFTRYSNTLNVVLPKPILDCFKRSFRYMRVARYGMICLQIYKMLKQSTLLNACIKKWNFNPI